MKGRGRRLLLGATVAAMLLAMLAAATAAAKEPHPTLKPTVTCVDETASGYVAHFGYTSTYTDEVDRVHLPFVNWIGGWVPQNQPETFLPGEHTNVIAVEFTGSSLSWALDGHWVRADASDPACPVAAAPQPPPRQGTGYCSVTGNTTPAGLPIVPGTFLNLVLGQPLVDAHYAGATPALYVEGVGITCDPPPVGFSFDGAARVDGLGLTGPGDGHIYPYYTKG
jgi:hypothetical protein